MGGHIERLTLVFSRIVRALLIPGSLASRPVTDRDHFTTGQQAPQKNLHFGISLSLDTVDLSGVSRTRENVDRQEPPC